VLLTAILVSSFTAVAVLGVQVSVWLAAAVGVIESAACWRRRSSGSL